MNAILPIEQSAAIGALAKALAAAQGEIETAEKDSVNPHFKSSYADLASIWRACRAALSKHGIAVVQPTMHADGFAVVVATQLIHADSGEWMRGYLGLNPIKQDPQGIGSAITYGRRYGLAAMVGVAPDDDDGNAASGNHAPAPQNRNAGGNPRAATPAPKLATPSGNPRLQSIANLCKQLNAAQDKPGTDDQAWNPRTLNTFAQQAIGHPIGNLDDGQLGKLQEILLRRLRSAELVPEIQELLRQNGHDEKAFWTQLATWSGGRELSELTSDEIALVMEGANSDDGIIASF